MKIYIMTEPTFLERSLDKVKDYGSDVSMLNKMIGHIEKNKDIYIKLVATTALLLIAKDKAYAANSYKELDNLYIEILRLGSKIGKIACIGGGIFEVAKAAIRDGDNKAATKIIIKYLLIYSTIGVLDMGFNMIDNTLLQNRI